ncbi:MAG: Immunity protein 49 [Rickettsiaceae bacterium]|jgi:hypothetical protein|nr:Immunity protein 49 [Rickettsiaceae bacterium]
MVDFEQKKDFYNRLIKEYIPQELENLNSEDRGIYRNNLQELSEDYFILASLEYGLFHNIDKCREDLNLFKEYSLKYIKARVTDVPTKYSATFFAEMLYALCTGDPDFYLEYIRLLDGHADYDEKPSKHGADWMHRALAWMILERNLDKVPDALEKAKASFNPKGQYKAMYPYVLMLEAIWEKDEKKFYENLELAAKKYSRQINGTFDEPQDTFLCWYGIGLCQLAKHKGMKINFDHKYIPAELIK